MIEKQYFPPSYEKAIKDKVWYLFICSFVLLFYCFLIVTQKLLATVIAKIEAEKYVYEIKCVSNISNSSCTVECWFGKNDDYWNDNNKQYAT